MGIPSRIIVGFWGRNQRRLRPDHGGGPRAALRARPAQCLPTRLTAVGRTSSRPDRFADASCGGLGKLPVPWRIARRLAQELRPPPRAQESCASAPLRASHECGSERQIGIDHERQTKTAGGDASARRELENSPHAQPSLMLEDRIEALNVAVIAPVFRKGFEAESAWERCRLLRAPRR